MAVTTGPVATTAPGSTAGRRRGAGRDEARSRRRYGVAVDGTDDLVEKILRTFATITVVGASTDPAKPAHYVPAHMQAHGWRIVPVNPTAQEILGEPVFASLAMVPGPIGLVNVFRPPSATPEIARQAVAVGATALWLQRGITSSEARAVAEEAGLLYVEDRCLLVEQRRLGLEAPSD